MSSENRSDNIPGNGDKKTMLSEKLGKLDLKAWGSRLLALFGAFIIWFYAMSAESPTSEKDFSNLAVSLRNTAIITNEYGFSVLSGYDVSCDVTLYGKMSDLNRLNRDDIDLYVDLSVIDSAGSIELPVMASLPNGVTLASSFPERITVYVDKTTTKPIPVKVVETYKKASDIIIETPKLNYDSVTVSGPAAELDSIDHARLSVDLGEVTKSLEASGKIVLIDKDGFEVSNPYVKCNVSDVVASYDVNKYKDLPLIVQTKYGYLDSSNLSVDIDPHTIRVRGEPEAVDAVSFLVAAVIDEKLMTETTTNYSVSVKLPDGVEWVDGATDSIVNVNIAASLVDLHTRTLNYALNIGTVTVVPPGTGRGHTILTSKLNIKIRGDYVAVNMAEVEDLNIILDLSSYTASGTYNVPLTVAFKNESGEKFVVGDYSMEVLLL